MKKNVELRFISLIAAIVLLVFAIYIFFIQNATPYFSPANSKPIDDPLKSDLFALVERYKNNEVDYIDISTITKFAWDRLYVIGPYMAFNELDNLVGNTWRLNCDISETHTSDGYVLLVFSNKNIVAHCLDYPNYENYFFIPTNGYNSGFSSDTSHFVIDELGRIVWKYYK